MDKVKIYCTCKGNTIWRLGGEIVKITREGLEITKTKGQKPKCIECGKLKKYGHTN